MKKYLFLAFILFNLTSCSSYDIKLNQNINQPISISVILLDYPEAVTVKYSDEFNDKYLYKNTYEKIILESYNSVNLNILFNKAFNKIDSSSKINYIYMNNETFSNIETSKSVLKNKYAFKTDLSKINDKIETPYVMVIKIIKWGHNSVQPKSDLTFTCSLYSKEGGEPLWMVYRTISKSTQLILTSNDNFNNKKAENFLNPTIKRSVESINESLLEELTKN